MSNHGTLLLAALFLCGGGSACGSAPTDRPSRASPHADIEDLERQWSRGSGYTRDEDTMNAARNRAAVEVYGTLLRSSSRAAFTHYEYEQRSYEIRVAAIRGYVALPVIDPVTKEIKGERPAAAGDSVWFHTRVKVRLDGEIQPERALGFGEKIWAVFSRLAGGGPEFSGADTLLAWSSGDAAVGMSLSMK